MPNWVKNRVRAANGNDARRLFEILLRRNDSPNPQSEYLTNFDGVIPMPEELRHTTAGYGNPEWEAEHRRCLEKYGYKDWYDFAVAEWGTKWDLNQADIDGFSAVFSTAWDRPDGIYRKISESVPLLVAYADEDSGNNVGILRYEDGEVVKIELPGVTDVQLANAIWGSEYDEENGDWDSEDNYSEDAERQLEFLFRVPVVP